MTIKLKMMGVAVLAAFTLSAAFASNASAEPEFWFRTDGSPTLGVGEQVVENGDVFKVDGGAIRCQKTHYTGAQTGMTFTTLVSFASYEGCKFAGILPLVVSMNSCYYVSHADAATGEGKYHVITTIECEIPGDEITATISSGSTAKCTLHFPEQSVGISLTATNTESEGVKEVTGSIEATEVTYSQTPGSGIGACATADNTSNGVYEGSDTATGFNENEERTSIWIE